MRRASLRDLKDWTAAFYLIFIKIFVIIFIENEREKKRGVKNA